MYFSFDCNDEGDDDSKYPYFGRGVGPFSECIVLFTACRTGISISGPYGNGKVSTDWNESAFERINGHCHLGEME